MSPSSGPQPLPAHSALLRTGRVEAELSEAYRRPEPCSIHEPEDPDCRPSHGGACSGRNRRRVFETGRFRKLSEARLWAALRLLEVEAAGMHSEPEASFVGYHEARGWRAQDHGRITLDEARALELEEVDR